MKLEHGKKILSLEEPQVMGIINMTPDSFSDGGQFNQIEKALSHARSMLKHGVKVIDIGGESTRPGAEEVGVDEEIKRVLPLVKELRKISSVWISVDTSKPEVMQSAIEAGANMINDVRALQKPGALSVIASAGVPVCIVPPKTRHLEPGHTLNFIQSLKIAAQKSIEECLQGGISRSKIVLDPGFGFGKTLKQNYELLANLATFKGYGLPLLTGLSRKGMLNKPLVRKPEKCVTPSVVGAVLCAERGANILRVHDVIETIDSIKLFSMMKQQKIFSLGKVDINDA